MKNEKLSLKKKTKHLDICYFYVKDLLDRGIVQVQHCVSDDVIADLFTKPLQGSKFQMLHGIILIINRINLPYNTRAC
jgi:hypothetical protein